MGLTSEQCLMALGISASQREVVPIRMPVQRDSAFLWKAAAIHPLQPLENAYQRIVRRNVDRAGEREAEFEQLGKFFLFEDSSPSAFSRAVENGNGDQLAAVKMNYAIGTFYLFRLLVQFAIQSDQEVTDEVRAKVSGTLTSLLHNDKTYMSWLSAWLTEKISQIGDEVEKLNTGGNKVIFFLKGGRALKCFLGKPEEGENDWDTQILINPELPAEEWYRMFSKVHDTMLAKLTEFKAEFTELVESHKGDFDLYIRSIQQELPPVAEEEEDDEFEEESSRSERNDVSEVDDEDGLRLANCKAELIDIGIPRRDTPAALEEWTHLNGHLLGKRLRYPSHEYYLNEYHMMIREAYLPTTDVRKTPKRVQRLKEILELDRLGPAVEPERAKVRAVLPKISQVADGRGVVSSRLFTTMMSQFVKAYDLKEDSGLTEQFDATFAAAISGNAGAAPLRPELTAAISGFKAWGPGDAAVLSDIGIGHQISTRMTNHYQERARFMKDQRKLCRAFIGEINAGFSKDEDLEIEMAIAGSYAAHLHAKYFVQSALLSELEPIRRIDLKVYTRQGAGQGALQHVQPTIERLLQKPEYPFEMKTGEGPSLLLFWRDPVKLGEFTFKPLVIKVSVQEEKTLPQLAFIKGLPVLDLRFLATEYRRRAAEIDEPGVRAVLKSATTAVSEILSCFEF